VKTKQLKEYQVLDIKAYIVHAYDEEEALDKFGDYDYVQEGDSWPEARELGPVNSEGTGPE
jgi:hypothetical protein